MRTSTKHTMLALAVTAVLGSCSRPVATFQPSKAERFYTQQATPAEMPTPTVTLLDEGSAAIETPATVSVAPAATKENIESMLVKAEAMASTKARPAEARKLERRISKMREVLATTPKSNLTTTTTTTKKAGLAQRLMMKSMDKKIQKKLAPNQPDQPMRSSTLTAGLVIGLIGLLLLLLTSGTVATIGLIALVVGIVLVILGLL